MWGGHKLIRHKTVGMVIGLVFTSILVLFVLINQWTPGLSVWCHNPLSVPVLVKYNRTKEIIIQPWAYTRINLSRGTHQIEVLSDDGSTRLDAAQVTLPASGESEVIYSIQGIGTYVLGEAMEDGKGYQRTILKDQQILLPGKIGEPLLPGGQGTPGITRWFEFAPTQRLVLAEEAAGNADWSRMLNHAQVAVKTFAPSADDPFLAFCHTLENRALANLGRMEEAIQAAKALASATPTNREGATLAQNLLVNYLPAHVVKKTYQDLIQKEPTGLDRSLLGRIEGDLAKARELLLEAMTDPVCAHSAAEFLLQRCLYENEMETSRELLARFIKGGTEEDDFLRTSLATSQILSEASPESVWREVKDILPRMDEPLSLVPWLVTAAARVGEVSSAMELVARVDWSDLRGKDPGPPTLLFWKTQILLEQNKDSEARSLVEQSPHDRNIWDLVADLDSALAVLPPSKALAICENHLKKDHPLLNHYRLAGYRLARECGLDEIGRQLLSPYAHREIGTPQRVIWEILEGEGWPPEKLLGFTVQHSPQETNDVVYALALRAQLDGDHQGTAEFLDRCIRYPPVAEFPAVLARRERKLLR